MSYKLSHINFRIVLAAVVLKTVILLIPSTICKLITKEPLLNLVVKKVNYLAFFNLLNIHAYVCSYVYVRI